MTPTYQEWQEDQALGDRLESERKAKKKAKDSDELKRKQFEKESQKILKPFFKKYPNHPPVDRNNEQNVRDAIHVADELSACYKRIFPDWEKRIKKVG
jgi:hypothetical protein